MKKPFTITLALVVLNEADGVRQILPKVPRDLFSEIIAVDGGSVDGTRELLEKNGITVYSQHKPGVGAAALEAIGNTTSDALILFHPDGNENPADLPRMVEMLRTGHPFVVGSRVLPGGFNEEDVQRVRLRKWANLGFAFFANHIFGRGGNHCTDPINGFRGITLEAVRRMKLTANDASNDYQMVIRALKLGIPISEFPTREGVRVGGSTHFASLPTGLIEVRRFFRELFTRG